MRKANRRNLIGAALLSIVVAVTAYLAAPYSASYAQPFGEYQTPSTSHLLGTDNLGRDTLSRLLWGANLSVSVALLSASIATILGTALGILAGLSGGIIDSIVSTLLDIWLSFPGLLVALLMMSMWGKEGMLSGFVLGLNFTPTVARLVRSTTIRLKLEDYVTASRALGASLWWITRRHIARNLTGYVSTYAALVFAWSLLSVTGLEFLGLIGESSTASWGQMINEGRAYLRLAPLNTIAPGLCLTLMVWIALAIADIGGE